MPRIRLKKVFANAALTMIAYAWLPLFGQSRCSIHSFTVQCTDCTVLGGAVYVN
jgi:hypothetical protein